MLYILAVFGEFAKNRNIWEKSILKLKFKSSLPFYNPLGIPFP
jgi:hypothetical protein